MSRNSIYRTNELREKMADKAAQIQEDAKIRRYSLLKDFYQTVRHSGMVKEDIILNEMASLIGLPDGVILVETVTENTIEPATV